jgi:hypothetical protein
MNRAIDAVDEDRIYYVWYNCEAGKAGEFLRVNRTGNP